MNHAHPTSKVHMKHNRKPTRRAHEADQQKTTNQLIDTNDDQSRMEYTIRLLIIASSRKPIRSQQYTAENASLTDIHDSLA